MYIYLEIVYDSVCITSAVARILSFLKDEIKFEVVCPWYCCYKDTHSLFHIQRHTQQVLFHVLSWKWLHTCMCVCVCVCNHRQSGTVHQNSTIRPRTTSQSRTVHDLWIRANGCKLPTLAYRGMLKKRENNVQSVHSLPVVRRTHTSSFSESHIRVLVWRHLQVCVCVCVSTVCLYLLFCMCDLTCRCVVCTGMKTLSIKQSSHNFLFSVIYCSISSLSGEFFSEVLRGDSIQGGPEKMAWHTSCNMWMQ